MKKYTLALALVALVPFVSASAYEYKQSRSGYYTTPTVKTSTYKRASTSRKTGGYGNVITNNFYYNQPVQSYTSRGVYKNTGYYNPGKKQSTTVKKSYSAQERKFFLANPFFQPLKGKVGSVTDLSYARNHFNFDMLNGTVYNIDPSSSTYLGTPVSGIVNPVVSGKANTSQFAVKEDLSYGLTDTLSLVLMAQYDKTKVEFNGWSDGTAGDSKSDSGLNVFGIGLQNRFVDTNEWIAMAEFFYQHQKDAANTFMGAVKAGYKVNRATIYGIGRISYSNLIKGDTYGIYVDNSTGDYLMLSYKTDIKNILQVEGGIGAFAVLNKYFTLNGEMMYGHYDWHNQLNIKGAIGWQPADSFALNLYASTSLYDSAKGKIRQYMNNDINPTAYPKVNDVEQFTDSKHLYTIGDYKIKDYNEWKIGVQAILYF